MKKSKYQNRYLKQTFKLKTTLNEKKKKNRTTENHTKMKFARRS